MKMRGWKSGWRVPLLTVTLAVAVPDAEAQSRAGFGGFGTQGGAGYFAIGGQRLDLSDLNQRMTAAGYTPFTEDLVSFGFGAYRLRERVLLGFDFQGTTSPTESTADGRFRTRLTVGTAMFDVGYVAHGTPDLRVYPFIGIGGGGTTLEITERAVPTFDEMLRDPRRGSRAVTPSLLADIGIGTDVRVTGRRPGGGRGLLLGVRVGHTFSSFDREWLMDTGGDLAGGPRAGVVGPYVRLAIGRWGAGTLRR